MTAAAQWNDRVRRRLKLRDVDILLAVIQTGSMGKAAGALNMSQPAVSKAIAYLEHTLGVRLLDRSRQGVEPTPYGRALIKRGVAMFDELRQGVQDIASLTDPTVGEIRMGGASIPYPPSTRPSSNSSRDNIRGCFFISWSGTCKRCPGNWTHDASTLW